MSKEALNDLRNYLIGTLSPNNMIWLAAQLTEQAKKLEMPASKQYTTEELNAMLDEAEAEIAAGKGTPHEEVMREWDEELEREEQEMLEMAEIA